MRNLITVSLFLLLGFGTIAQINQVDSQGRKQGKWAKKYESKSVLQYEGQFKNDKPIGKFVYKYPNDRVKAIIIHDEFSSRSEAYMYHENGKLMSFGIYKNQIKDSIWTHYSISERLSFKETYKNGKLDGLKTIYYVPEQLQNKSTVVMQTLTYENDVLSGPTEEFFPDGIKKMDGTYKNNALDGVVNKYHPNGQKEFVLRYKNEKKHGWWFTYNNQGQEIGRKYFYYGRELKGDALKNHMAKLKEAGKSPNE